MQRVVLGLGHHGEFHPETVEHGKLPSYPAPLGTSPRGPVVDILAWGEGGAKVHRRLHHVAARYGLAAEAASSRIDVEAGNSAFLSFWNQASPYAEYGSSLAWMIPAIWPLMRDLRVRAPRVSGARRRAGGRGGAAGATGARGLPRPGAADAAPA